MRPTDPVTTTHMLTRFVLMDLIETHYRLMIQDAKKFEIHYEHVARFRHHVRRWNPLRSCVSRRVIDAT